VNRRAPTLNPLNRRAAIHRPIQAARFLFCSRLRSEFLDFSSFDVRFIS
jgi:hypothetical protein